MVRAILDGSKTQTRRVVKPQPPDGHAWAGWCASSTHRRDEGKAAWAVGEGPLLKDVHRVACPYGQPGDRLWVRETWAFNPDHPGQHAHAIYRADPECEYDTDRWTPSIHMPRRACRILLEIVSVRVERLNDISEADCWAEGIEACDGLQDYMTIIGMAKRMGRQIEDAAPTFAALWESINRAGSWDANPWVWVVEFKRVMP
jgi:hypothetical protein